MKLLCTVIELLCAALIGVDSEELEEELKSLLEESATDGQAGLPEVPSEPLPSRGAPAALNDSFLNSLPPVPHSDFGITDEELDRELSRLTLADTGVIHPPEYVATEGIQHGYCATSQ